MWEGRIVKMLIAIIQPPQLDVVRSALHKIGVERMTVCDAQGYGRQRGQSAMYRGNEYKTNLLRKSIIAKTVRLAFFALMYVARYADKKLA